MKKLLCFVLSLLALVTMPYFIFAQQSSGRKVEFAGGNVAAPVPVVFGKKSDGMPEKFKLRGVITEISFSRSCGVVWWSGTLKIKLSDKVEGYPHDNVFVVVNCLEDSYNEKRYLRKVVEMEVSKLSLEYRKWREGGTFYFELIDNTINSEGVLFYCTNMWRDEILKNIELQQGNK